MSEYSKPLPRIDNETSPYWDACKRHELRMQRCVSCGQLRFPPGIICANCNSLEAEWVKLSGRGKVYTWNIFHQLYNPAFAQDLPYNVAVIELEEGPRITSNIVGCKNEDIHIGMAVEVVFEDITDDVTLPKFRPST